MRRVFLGLAMTQAMLVSTFAPMHALAADGHDKPGVAAHGGGHKEKSKNPLEIVADLAIWTAVVFLVLLFVLRKAAWKPMLEGLQKREANIRSAVEDAEKARDETRQIREQLATELAHANEKVREILDEARRDAQFTTEEMITKAKGEIQGERDRLHRELQTARDQALQQLWNQTAELATLISAKAVRRQLTADDHRRLTDEALNELRDAGNERRNSRVNV